MLGARREQPPRPPTTDELQAAAQQGLREMIRNSRAQLGQPYEIYLLIPSKVRQYKPGTRMSTMLERTHAWKFPVLIDGTMQGTIDVGFLDGRWQATGVDNATYLHALREFTAQPENQDLGIPVLVYSDPIFARFALFNKGLDQRLLRLSEARFYFQSLKDTQVYPTDEVMPQIIEAFEDRGAW
jgi:hypothetical protein